MIVRSILLFCGMLFATGIGIQTLLLDKKSKTNRIFLVFTLFISFFFFCHFMLSQVQDMNIALFWAWSSSLSLFIPPLFLYFIMEFLPLFQDHRHVRFVLHIVQISLPLIIVLYLAATGFRDIRVVPDAHGFLLSSEGVYYLVVKTGAALIYCFSIVTYIITIFIIRKKESLRSVIFILISFILIPLCEIVPVMDQLLKLIPDWGEIYFLLAGFVCMILSLWLSIRRFRLFYMNSSTASEQIVATMKDALFICDRDHTIHFNNGFASTLTGFSVSELTGTSFKELLYNDDYTSVDMNIIFRNHLDEEIDLVLKTKDRGSLPCSCIFSFFQGSLHTTPGYFCILRNISTRKVAEAALKAAKERSDAASKAKSEFLANMSHEIRTPLNIILGMSEMLKQVAREPEHQEYIDAITHSGNLLLRQLNNVLDMAQIESGKLQISLADFSLYDISREVFEIEKQNVQSSRKEIELLFDYDKSIPQWFHGDPVRIQQVLLNLASNSLKFTEKGYVKFHITGTGGMGIGQDFTVRISVEDTGIGIPVSKQNAIFKAFYQVDGSITRRFGGSGLGLAIVQKMISLMNGKINLTSKEGKGTTIKLEIPLFVALEQEEKKVITEIIAETTPSGIKEAVQIPGAKTVLIAEDDDLNRKMLTRMVTILGFSVDSVKNGREALDKLKGNLYSVILMDNHMPDLDGISATKIIREQMKLSIPIIGLTGDVFVETREKCLEAGMNHFLSKPFRMEELKILLKKYVTDV